MSQAAAPAPRQSPGRSKAATWAVRLRRVACAAALLLALATLVFAIYALLRFIPNEPVRHDSMEAHFKYGSTGGDQVTGIPVWIWEAMPLVCASSLQAIAGERLASDFLARVQHYSRDEGEAERRRALSREGYKAIGFLYETDTEGHELPLPIGMSRRRSLGLDRTYINCAICHTSTVRAAYDAPATVVVGMPANQFSLYDFEQFLFQCGKDGNPTRIPQLDFVAEIDSLGGELGIIDRYLVYPLAISALHEIVQYLENVGGFSARQPNWGPGRNDTFTNNKVFAYGYNWRQSMPDWGATGEVDPEGIGIVDWPSTWLQGQRKRRADGRPMQLHWDGNNDRVEERNLNAALATSAIPAVIDHQSIECIEQWMETLEPPQYMFAIDQALASRGQPIYARHCATCHGANGRDFSGALVGFVTPQSDVGTDRYRLDNYTRELALNMAATYAGKLREPSRHECPGGTDYQPQPLPMAATADDRVSARDAQENSYRYKHYRKTDGYANMPLDGLWLRAPYLHNGSVPTLRDLLNPVARRPTRFYRGNDVYDPAGVGFEYRHARDRDGRPFFEYITAWPGNSNQGHEGAAYGTELADTDKQALLEYLKTF